MKKILLNLSFVSIAIFSFLFIKAFNAYMLIDQHYGEQIFYLDPIFTQSQELFFGISIKIFLIYFFSFIILILFSKEIYSLFSRVGNYLKISDFVLVFFISILYKILVYQFNFTINVSPLYLEEIFVDGYFNDYKIYNYFVYYLSLFTDSYKEIVFLLQILIGSLTTSFFYLICVQITKNKNISFLVSLLVIMYMPLIAIHSYLWIDITYMFFFTLSFYFLFELVQKHSKRNISFFLSTMFICTLLREQTIYILPLYLFFIIINSKIERLKLLTLLSLVVILPTLIVSNINDYYYGMSSNMKSKILVIKSVQYGYLNEYVRPLYNSKLSEQASSLLDDIDTMYQSTILPHKKIAFKNYLKDKYGKDIEADSDIKGIKGLVKNKINQSILPLIRPDKETIRKKSVLVTDNNMPSFYNNIENIKGSLVSQFQTSSNSVMLSQDVRNNFVIVSQKYKNQNDKEIVLFYRGIVDQYCKDMNYSRECIISTLKSNVNTSFIKTRSDNYYYSKIGINFADNYNTTTKSFENHPHISHIEEIILSYPSLYIIQSILTATSILGKIPVDHVAIGESSRFYNNNYVPSILLERSFQRLYTLPVNLWYLFSILAMVGALLYISNPTRRNMYLLTALIPLYYGFFLSFSTYAEFLRLFTIISPFIFLNFFIFLIFVLKMIPIFSKRLKD